LVTLGVAQRFAVLLLSPGALLSLVALPVPVVNLLHAGARDWNFMPHRRGGSGQNGDGADAGQNRQAEQNLAHGNLLVPMQMPRWQIGGIALPS
jgi:hypothetical protein